MLKLIIYSGQVIKLAILNSHYLGPDGGFLNEKRDFDPSKFIMIFLRENHKKRKMRKFSSTEEGSAPLLYNRKRVDFFRFFSVGREWDWK